MLDPLPWRALADLVEAPGAAEPWVGVGHPLLAVDLDARGGIDDVALRRIARSVRALPVVLVGVTSDDEVPTGAAEVLDVVVHRDDPAGERIEATVRACPRASISLAILLRDAPRRAVDEGLAAESAVYSMLQAGPEFAAWRARHHAAPGDDGRGPAVRVQRHGDVLHVTLARPARHNALNAAMRDELYEALLVAQADPAISVLLDGDGPSFCSGGDLGEFGHRPDPASAHLVRLERSVGRLLAALAGRVEVVVHGSCLGAGLELPAFAHRVVARPDARFGLPELGLGLVPGAGGTVSLVRRAGRHRVALLALTRDEIDVPTALAWGLVDAVADG